MSKFDMKFTSYDDIFKSEETRQEEALERVQELPVEQFHNFQCHPFQIRQDEEMQNLVESITTYGVLTPILARPLKEENQYEIVSGHRRVHACKLAGIEKVPVLVRDLTDDEATILMVDSNLQREHLLYSEKATSGCTRAIRSNSARILLSSVELAFRNLRRAGILKKRFLIEKLLPLGQDTAS